MRKMLIDEYLEKTADTISNFDGIRIEMDRNRHPPPHIHAWYGGRRYMINLDGSINPLHPSPPSPQLKLIRKWLREHRAKLELMFSSGIYGMIGGM